MNHEKIGHAAGIVWNRLNEVESEGVTMTELKKLPGLTTDEVVAAVGWLSREGKLNFQAQGRKSLVTLDADAPSCI